MAEEKGLLQSKTILHGLGLAGLNLALIVGMLNDYMPRIEMWLMGFIPRPFDQIIAPSLMIVMFLLTYFFGSGVMKGRKNATANIKGLWKK